MLTKQMACIFVAAVLIALLVLVSKGFHAELARTGFTWSKLAGLVTFVVLMLIAGFIFLSKFRFLR